MLKSKTQTIERLIVPLDESHESERALPVAVRFAERLGIPAELLTIADRDHLVGPLRERLAALAHQSGEAVESTHVLRGDDIASEVGRRAGQHPGSMIVISSHGPAFTSGLLTESVAAELLADGLSVVIVGPHAEAQSTELPVVACLDESIESEAVIPAASAWAEALGVPLVLLAVTRPLLDPLPTTMPAHLPATDSAAPTTGPAAPAATEKQPWYPDAVLRRAAVRVAAERPALDVRTHVVSYPWNVADALSMYLERHPAQLVGLAMHVRHGWSQLIHPSVTRPTVREVTAPVLVVPIEAGEVDEMAATERNAPFALTVRPFSRIIMPIERDDDGPDTAMETATRLAVAADVPLSFFTCVTDDPVEHAARHHHPAAPAHTRPTEAQIEGDDGAWSWQFVESDDVAGTVIRAAAAAPDSIVCLGTDAPGQLIDEMLSTTTGRIVRWSPRTVVLAGPRCAPPPGMYSEIVGWVDGSGASEAVAELTGLWAEAFSLPARIVEVVDPASRIPGDTPLAERFVSDLAMAAAVRHGIAIAGETVAGADVAGTIRHWAQAHPDALLVMASHGSGLSEHPLGAVVMDVVRHAPTPVAVIPAHAGEPPSP